MKQVWIVTILEFVCLLVCFPLQMFEGSLQNKPKIVISLAFLAFCRYPQIQIISIYPITLSKLLIMAVSCKSATTNLLEHFFLNLNVSLFTLFYAGMSTLEPEYVSISSPSHSTNINSHRLFEVDTAVTSVTNESTLPSYNLYATYW